MEDVYFSIVIPTYNHGHLISKCLESIISQTFHRWEVIVVNNFSSDNTIEVVNGFGDPRIRIVNIHNDGVIAKSRNKGISLANGQWICLLDSDDLWVPSKLEVVYSKIQSGDFDVVCHSMFLVNEEYEVLRRMECGVKTQSLYKTLLLDGNRIQNSSVCVRRAFLDEHSLTISEEPDFSGVEDYDFMMQLALRNARFVFLSEPLGYYLVNGNNFSMSDKFFSHLEALIKYHIFTINKIGGNPEKNWKYVNARILLKKGNSCIHKKDYLRGIRCWLNALIKSPKAVTNYLKNRISLLQNQ